MAPAIANPGPEIMLPIPFTIPRAKSLPIPSPSITPLTFSTKELKKLRTFLRLSVTPISPRVLASSFTLITVSLSAADRVWLRATFRV